MNKLLLSLLSFVLVVALSACERTTEPYAGKKTADGNPPYTYSVEDNRNR